MREFPSRKKEVRPKGGSVEIEGTGGTGTGTLHDVQVNHRRCDAGVAQKGLHRADVGTAFQQVRGEGVAQGVAGGAFGDAGFFNSGFELPLQGVFMKVMPRNSARSGVGAKVGRGKEVLPPPLFGSVRVFATQGFRQMHLTQTDGPVLLMTQSSSLKVAVEPVLELAGAALIG